VRALSDRIAIHDVEWNRQRLPWRQASRPHHDLDLHFVHPLRCPANAPAQPRRARVPVEPTPRLPSAGGCSGLLGGVNHDGCRARLYFPENT